MIDPLFLATAGANVALVYENLYLDTVEDITRRIVKALRETGGLTLTPTAMYQVERLIASGMPLAEIERRVTQLINADPQYRFITGNMTAELNANLSRYIGEARRQSVIEVRQLFQDVALQTYLADNVIAWQVGRELIHPDQSPFIQRIITARIEGVNTSLENLTGSFNTNTLTRFNEILGNAYIKTVSGAFSYTQAVNAAVDEIARAGVGKATYKSGRSIAIEAAVYLTCRTSAVQTAGVISLRNARELGADLIYVSAHAGARNKDVAGRPWANHEKFQGKVFHINWNEYDAKGGDMIEYR